MYNNNILSISSAIENTSVENNIFISVTILYYNYISLYACYTYHETCQTTNFFLSSRLKSEITETRNNILVMRTRTR